MISTGFQDPLSDILRQELWGGAQKTTFEQAILTQGSKCSEATILVCLGQAGSLWMPAEHQGPPYCLGFLSLGVNSMATHLGNKQGDNIQS